MRLTSLIAPVLAILAWTSVAVAESPPVHPLEPPDRSSPRATLTVFLDSIDQAWELYQAGDPHSAERFRVAENAWI